MHDSISVYMQVYNHKRATLEALRSFRTFYRTEPVTVLSDDGEDFASICEAAKARYIHAQTRTRQGPHHGAGMGLDGVLEYLRRIYEHCISVDSDWVVLFDEDVRTLRRIRAFPGTDAAGPRMNPYSPALTQRLIAEFGHRQYGYGICGGAIWRRMSFIKAYESNRSIAQYVRYDDRLDQWSDIPLTLLFHINSLTFSVWNEVSELTHPHSPIVRDSAFDHAYKRWYGEPFDGSMLGALATLTERP